MRSCTAPAIDGPDDSPQCRHGVHQTASAAGQARARRARPAAVRGLAAGARLFATELCAFLYGPGSPQRKFKDWLEALADLPAPRSPVMTWPIATVFGFIARPERHLFFKPKVTQRAARAYAFDLHYASRPSWEGYQQLLTFAAVIRRDLDRRAHFKARDMIDVQSFIWVQGADEYGS